MESIELRRAEFRFLLIESSIAIIAIGVLLHQLLERFFSVPNAIAQALGFFAAMVLIYSAGSALSRQRGRPVSFFKYLVIFFGAAVVWMSAVGLGF